MSPPFFLALHSLLYAFPRLLWSIVSDPYSSLQFIDATKRGGRGRFANHSCDPNCYVAKWTVGAKVRMGIFAKRNIKKDEELTFNYNVDRYG